MLTFHEAGVFFCVAIGFKFPTALLKVQKTAERMKGRREREKEGRRVWDSEREGKGVQC